MVRPRRRLQRPVPHARAPRQRRRRLRSAAQLLRYRTLYGLIWLQLVGEALILAPSPQRPDQGAWVWRLLIGDWAGEEPLVVALFQLMGVWPLALAALLAPRLRRRPVPLWPFALSSLAIGAFGLLPGLALGGTDAPMVRWQRWLCSRWVAAGLALPAVALMAWGLVSGDPDRFLAAWRTDPFVHVMTLDFLALWLASIVAAREQSEPGWSWTLLPLVGTLIVVARRAER